MTPDQIIAVVSALLAAEPDGSAFAVLRSGGADPVHPVTIEACPRPLPPGEVEGRTVICGRFSTPERHDRPDGKRIGLAFAVLKARTESPAPDPLIYLHGGPGGGAVRDLAGIVAPLWDGWRARRDVVTFDQRAAGISSDMVTCFETLGANLVDLLAPKPGGGDGDGLGFFAACFGELAAKGVDLPAYNTVENAKDVRGLMRTLGYADYNIYGVSYGTTLGLEVMRSAPEGVRSVVLDSVSPPHTRHYDENNLPVQEGIQATLDLCAADSTCAAAFPDLEATLFRVAAKLKAQPIPAARGRPEITVRTLVALFAGRNGAGRWPQTTAHIPLILTEWDRGETTTWDMLSSGGTARLPTAAQILKAHHGSLSPEQRALAALILDEALSRRPADAATARAVQALADSLARAGAGATGLAARYDEAVTRAIVATRDRSRMMTFLRAYAGLTTLPPDAATLRALAADHLPSEDAAAAIAIVDLMSPGDVAETFAAVARDMRRVIAPFVALIDLDVVSCQEAVPFNTRQGYDAVNARLKFPFILDAEDGAAALFYGTCAGVPPAPRPGHHEPVTSDIPALVLYGLADTQTAAADARSTAEHLGRAQALAVPEAGHGALIFSQCVKDIGMAFVERPGEALDTVCLDRLKPRWVLPRP